MRTPADLVDRACIDLALAATVAGFSVEATCPWPRGYCAMEDPALMSAALGSIYLAARSFAWSCRWLQETLRGLLDPGPDPPADDGPAAPENRNRFAEG